MGIERLFRFGVVDHALEIDDNCRFVADYPCVVTGREQGNITRLAVEFRAVIHAHTHCARDVILKVRSLATPGFCDGLDGFRPSPAGSNIARPTVAPPILINSKRPFGNSRTSSGVPKLFSSAFFIL